MKIIIKTKEEIEILREGGKRLATILKKVGEHVAPGISAYELDQIAEKLIRAGGDEPAFLGYKPEGHASPYPASLCVSVNSEVVHGIPFKEKVLKEGDVVSIDLGLKHRGLFTDHAITLPVGKISKKDAELIRVSNDALMEGIFSIVPGARVGDIGHAIENFVKPYKYGIVRVLSGHGVGKYIHEDPYVPNFGKKGTGVVLTPGMVIAIEPMLTLGSDNVIVAKDGYTIRTTDGTHAAHFEHTVLITEEGYEVLTTV